MKILLVFATLAVLQATAVRRPSSERRLIRMLVQTSERFGVRGRPVEDVKSVWNVTVGLTLTHFYLDAETNALDAAYWLFTSWNDMRLFWETDHFDGVGSVRLNPSDIATPDIVPYNAISRHEEISDVPVVVDNNGKVIWVNPLKQRFSCVIPPVDDRSEFNCTMKFGSWTYSLAGIDLTLNTDTVDVTYMSAAPTWDLVSTSAVREATQYDCCPDKYVSVTYTMTFRRK